MTTFDQDLERAWAEHAGASQAVADRMPALVAAAVEPDQRMRLVALVLHLFGEHLGRWQEGVACLATLGGSDPATASPPALRAALERARAVLLFGAGENPAGTQALEAAITSDPQLPAASHRTRVYAVAAGALAAQDRMLEAGSYFSRALAESAYGPEGGDPAARVLAITGNNLACELETRGAGDAPTRQLLLEAATAARRWWAVAGGELEIGRAEYRLAKTCLVLGQVETALIHARLAFAHAQDPQVPPVDRAFAHLAIAECLDRLQRPAEAVQARAAAASLLPTLIPEMRTLIERELAQASASRTRSGSG